MLAASRSRPALVSLVVIVALALLALSVAVAPVAAAGPPDPVRFATFNASLNRNAAGQPAPTCRHRTKCPSGNGRRDHPARQPRRLASHQRVRLRPGGRRAVPDELPRGAARTAPAVEYPYLFIAPSKRGVLGVRPEQ